MMENIKVFDNFFSEELRQEIWGKMMRPKWNFTGGNPTCRFWHMNNLEEERYFNNDLYNHILKKLGPRFERIIIGCNRIYANGMGACQCGNPHRDDGDLTFLYYPNPEWPFWWQGHLMFLNKIDDPPAADGGKYHPSDDDDIVKTVAYKPNRAVIFPANYYHYAQAPHRHCNALRVSLAYKFLVQPS